MSEYGCIWCSVVKNVWGKAQLVCVWIERMSTDTRAYPRFVYLSIC